MFAMIFFTSLYLFYFKMAEIHFGFDFSTQN